MVEIAPLTKTPVGVPVFERFELSASVLFPHDRSARADMRALGRTELSRLAAHIEQLVEVTSVTVVGHADLTGTAAHNLALSRRRAATVAAALAAHGVDPAKIVAVGVSRTEPVVSCGASLKRAHRSRYLICLEPNRRVTIELAGRATSEAPEGDTLKAASPRPTWQRIPGGERARTTPPSLQFRCRSPLTGGALRKPLRCLQISRIVRGAGCRARETWPARSGEGYSVDSGASTPYARYLFRRIANALYFSDRCSLFRQCLLGWIFIDRKSVV